MTSWVSNSSSGKFSQAAEKLHDGEEEEFHGSFSATLEDLADSLDNNSRMCHCSPGPCDANNNIKMRDPLLCIGSVPTLMNSQTPVCVEDHLDKAGIVYQTLASQSNRPAAGILVTNSAQTSSITQSDWSNIITTINFGQFYHTPFQYVLNAATTPCSKINDESLTYLNQGQSYELKLKKIGETSHTDQYFMSIVRVIFHERRLQYMEKEQLDTWKHTRPGERILDIDIPLSYGLVDVKIDPEQLSCLHFVWDSHRDSSGVYIKLNAISTEFTAKRHGGEKGVPFRIQVETYALPTTYVQPHSFTGSNFNFSDISTKLIHCASCQVKVFKPKGADRKYKTDREKIDKKSESEKEKYQPAFDYTVLSEIPLEQVRSYLEQQSGMNKPSVSSTSVDCSVSSPAPHFQMKSANQNAHLFQQDAFFSPQCNEAGVMETSPYHVMNQGLAGNRVSGSLQLEEAVFADHSGVLQSSINDFQRIQQLYHTNTPDPSSENFLNCFSYGEMHKSPSPIRSRTAERPHETNECTVSVISPGNNPASPSCGEVKRVIYGPYNTVRLPPTSLHGGVSQSFHCQVRSSLSPEVTQQDKKKEDAFKAISSTSLSSTPVVSKAEERPAIGQDQAPCKSDSPCTYRSQSAGSLQHPTTDSGSARGHDHLSPQMESQQVEQWLVRNRFDACVQHFNEFTGADLLRLSREDLIQICGTVNGIRLNNALHSKPIRPKLTLYVAATGRLADIKKNTFEDTNFSRQRFAHEPEPTRSVPRPGSRSSVDTEEEGGRVGGEDELEKKRRKKKTRKQQEEEEQEEEEEEVQSRSRRTGKRCRSPELLNTNGRIDDKTGVESQTKKYKKAMQMDVDGCPESDVHAVFMEVASMENLINKLSEIFLLDPAQVKSIYLRRGTDRVNVIVNDLVVQNLSDGLKLSVDIRDYSLGRMSLQLISWD